MANSTSPFHTIVITSPDSESAKSAQNGPLHMLSGSCTLHTNNKNDVNIYSTSDPFDTRMGSGGGTLAALEYADHQNNSNKTNNYSSNNENDNDNRKKMEHQNDEDGSVLIIHAGGQSSRCPTQITLGKAWTSLPLSNDKITNPTYLLIDSLSKVCKNLPKGSVVVAASDVLLSLHPSTIETGTTIMDDGDIDNHDSLELCLDFENQNENLVLGLAVPAPLHTAKNHGVFVLEQHTSTNSITRSNDNNNGDDDDDDDDDKITKTWNEQNSCIKTIDLFLQKPSIDTMKNIPNCVLKEQQKQEKAWIDTGVIIFLPKAAKALRTMIDSDLNICTKTGLETLYNKSNISNVKSDNVYRSKIKEFAKNTSAKIELYSHLLLALKTKQSKVLDYETRFKEYLSNSSNQDLDVQLLTSIFDTLSKFELRVCIVPNGSFIHLGTSNEMKDFLVYGASSSSPLSTLQHPDIISNHHQADERKRCFEFGNSIGLAHHSQVLLNSHAVDGDGCDVPVDSSSTVILNTMLSENYTHDGSRSCIIGKSTVVEHCQLKSDINIGSNCLISGLRGRCKSRLTIPSNFVCQMIKLRKNWREMLGVSTNDDETNEECFVYIYHNINDDIKKHNNCYGIPFEKLFEKNRLSYDDLWEVNDEQKLLWNAKINPVVSKTGMSSAIDWSIFTWINHFIETSGTDFDDNEASVKESFNKWKTHTRISLSQLRAVADASYEFKYRADCQRRFEASNQFQNVLLSRLHDELNLEGAVDDEIGLISTLDALDKVIIQSIKAGSFDISSRAFMMIGNIFSFLAEKCTDEKNVVKIIKDDLNIYESIAQFKSLINDGEKRIEICKDLLRYRDFILLSQMNKCSFKIHAGEFEDVAFALTELCVSRGIKVARTKSSTSLGIWTIASAPARVDISGGWSDTPPISYEFGGAVAGIAVTVNGRKPLQARCRKFSGSSGILLCTESRDINTGKLIQSERVYLNVVKDLSDYCDPSASCALLKCALLILGLYPIEKVKTDATTCDDSGTSLHPYTNSFCGTDVDVGLEVISTSFLPRGSGMGSSSILAACILAAVSKCIGLAFVDEDCDEKKNGLTKGVLFLEQLLTTGGGWQDQIGGIYGGLKLGESKTCVLPMQLKVNQFSIPTNTEKELNSRMALCFTGQPRLAKNILRNVLRQWTRRSPAIVSAVNDLVRGAHESIQAIQNGDIDQLGKLITSYWSQKKIMAGSQSGVEPPVVKEVIELLTASNIIIGSTLCGAGGGGFLYLLFQKGKSASDAQNCLKDAELSHGSVELFSWYECEISLNGLDVIETNSLEIK